ncbi:MULTISPECIES: hypothetical protein [Bacillus cereus group]|uniref:hypothetical protein n=1 Tax=Bacillus cereus group TaxID=86661 RepID=UPI001AEED577|nr:MULTISPECIES: hypothetical protein [Bacillus cereus group]QTR71877.1 hypothetical protein JC775_04590 [Bacillus cytotoxicus]HDR4571200.1 hypothetical protein [Bacillus cytotoxicus]HDR4587011.1 hypothetical protein [Bacillus cytotoxicus]HDR7315346.1 hypothetical protein [Bacillus cytotoxicus]
MIYKKDANFPYPLLTNTSTSYESSQFTLDVQLQENVHSYRFDIQYEIDSGFMNRLLEQELVQLILVIQSKDNKFFKLSRHEKAIEIPKSRISVSKRTTIQLHLQSKEDINFKDNDDLSEFYQQFKDNIIVPKHSILGFSNVVMFEGSSTKPLDLFEKKVDPHLPCDIKIELSSETIIIHYKHEQLQFNSLPMSNTLNNPYIYMGLQKALYRFIVNNGDDGEQVDLEQIDIPIDQLDFKLYNLMRKKMIYELSVDSIDEVIYAISDRIIEKYASAVRGLSLYGN